ncbi:perlucin-like protein [Ruditapes philippinarum]|uniref:perlucin-like protein n=1 Tax=Ruditapes philippinarum TaxID=129788 RepID=UPI00295AC65A|nr:perlucin-like protein [Ruditapes philippinarum]
MPKQTMLNPMMISWLISQVDLRELSPFSFGCRSGWVTHGSSCYHFSHDTEPWTGAQHFCREMKGQLVEINDVNENAFIKAQVKLRKQTFWIGLTDVEEEGTWMWMNSQTLLTSDSFTNWAPGQPDNALDNENCACFYMPLNFLWNDCRCHDNYYYICEMTDHSSEIVG